LVSNLDQFMSSEQTFRLFTIVNKHFKNEEDSRLLVAEIEQVVDQKFDLEVRILATKADLTTLREDVKEEINTLRAEVKEEINTLRAEVKADISRLEVKMEAGFKDQLKWIILLMMGMTSLIITVVKIL